MWKQSLLAIVMAALLFGTAAQAARDITKPGDVIQGIPNDGISQNDNHGWPGNEPPPQAIDDRIDTKYLHFKGEIEPTGLRVTPQAGPTVVTGLSFTTANDAEPRDPIKYELSGSNESIDGPYTLIASGDIVDFAGAAVWPRRTKNTTPIQFANTVAYKHYQLMFPLVRDPGGANSMQIAEVELLADVLKASAPDPADGAVITMPLFRWTKGDTAVFHNVYFGTSPDLTEADLRGNRQLTTLYYHVLPLEPGVTYYWRVDEIDGAGNVYPGDVWSVLVAPKKAYNPSPRNGDKWLPTSTQLAWDPGQGATQHEVYFGTDQAAVEARDASVFKVKQVAMVYDPGSLQENTTYYWVVDEIVGANKVAGDVWEFTTIGGTGGAKGEYFNNVNLSGLPVLTRIDPEINVNLTGDLSPGAPVPGDGWSARWTADLDIAVADTFTFSINCQDGTRMWIDGELIIDQWITPTVTSKYYSLPQPLERGIHSLRVEFFDSGGDAVEQLAWSTPTMAEVIIPAGPLQPPLRAQAVYPKDGDVNIPQDMTVVWSAGLNAAMHDVYFGDDKDAVAGATPATAGVYRGQQALDETTFDPGPLEWNKTYYWRIDEVNDAKADSPWASSVWSFTTADFLVVDDIESYTDDEGSRIYETWIDGYTDSLSGSTVGYFEAPFAERTIVHSGAQSMPLEYNNVDSPFFSEAYREFAPVQDWTVNDINTLKLYVRGYPAPATVTETAPGQFSVTGGGADIWNTADEFTFVFKTLNGDGTLVAHVVSNGTGSNTWAKGGVMIRDGLDAGSTHAMMVITDGGGNGASFQWRPVADTASSNSDATAAVAPPYWVKIERTGQTLKGSISANGTTWTQIGTDQFIPMIDPVYVGLCVTSHVAGQLRTYEFDNVKTTGSVTGQWRAQDIGLTRNSPQNLYVIVEDSAGKQAVASDATAVNAADWVEVAIPLSDFAGVNMTKVEKLYIGVGDRDNPAADGAGMLFIDDIRVTK